MKSVLQRITSEIEYLRALADLYDTEDNPAARQAALAAIDALQNLLHL